MNSTAPKSCDVSRTADAYNDRTIGCFNPDGSPWMPRSSRPDTKASLSGSQRESKTSPQPMYWNTAPTRPVHHAQPSNKPQAGMLWLDSDGAPISPDNKQLHDQEPQTQYEYNGSNQINMPQPNPRYSPSL